ncbi:MAG: hypothetical protein Q8L48_42070 [Archangium sp.]|nr:hypothetical protein [Archangium sp.]
MSLRLLAVLALAQHFEIVSDCGGAEAPPVKDAPARQVVGGGFFGCAVDEGAVRCWGNNERGQLGRGSTSRQEASGVVTLPEKVAQLALGEASACARTVTGGVWCWGDNGTAQLGAPSPAFSAVPLEVKVPVPVAKLALHSDFALALGSDGRLFGWGNDAEGTLGRDNVDPGSVSPTPVVRAAFTQRFTDITAGQGNACGLTPAGELWCWGRVLTAADEGVRTPVKFLDGVSAVVSGAFVACAIRSGELWCWGSSPTNDGLTMAWPVPTRLELGGGSVRQVDSQWFHVCAVTTLDTAWCWGRGIEGQLGLGGTDPFPTPQLVTAEVESVATGFFFTCLRRKNGAVACTGANEFGQLGLGDSDRRYVPQDQ